MLVYTPVQVWPICRRYTVVKNIKSETFSLVNSTYIFFTVEASNGLISTMEVCDAIQAPSSYTVNGSNITSTYNLTDSEITHAEPSARPISVENGFTPPITKEPLQKFKETPPPRYEDLYKTTNNWIKHIEGFVFNVTILILKIIIFGFRFFI